jgi:GMP synthase-like glutamine amidotransferase
MRVGLLECDHIADRFRHIAGDYHDMFARWLRRAIPELEVETFDVCHGQLPPSVDACDAYVCGASRWSVFDDQPWIPPLNAFVRALRDAERPFVGICFGHQLMAEALGGRVARGTSWGIGVQRIDVTRHEPWMQPARERLQLLHSHQDQIAQLPPDAIVLGSSPHCPVALFRVGPTMLGIQAHPELDGAYVEALMIDRTERIGAEPVRLARATLSTPTDADIAGQWVREFLGECADGSPTGPTAVSQRARHAGRRGLPSHP